LKLDSAELGESSKHDRKCHRKKEKKGKSRGGHQKRKRPATLLWANGWELEEVNKRRSSGDGLSSSRKNTPNQHLKDLAPNGLEGKLREKGKSKVKNAPRRKRSREAETTRNWSKER